MKVSKDKTKDNYPLKTSIDGLLIYFNKFIEDYRGYLCEIAPKGFKNDILKKYGVSNIVFVSFSKKGIHRGSHYHKENYDIAYVPYGTALWYFYDTRPNSKSFKKEEFILVGKNSLNKKIDPAIKDLTIEKNNKLALIVIPPGVYHIIFSLSQVPAVIIEFSSKIYDESDYIRIKPEKFEKFKEIQAIVKQLT